MTFYYHLLNHGQEKKMLSKFYLYSIFVSVSFWYIAHEYNLIKEIRVHFVEEKGLVQNNPRHVYFGFHNTNPSAMARRLYENNLLINSV